MSLFGIGLIICLEAMSKNCPNNSVKNQLFCFLVYVEKQSTSFWRCCRGLKLKWSLKINILTKEKFSSLDIFLFTFIKNFEKIVLIVVAE